MFVKFKQILVHFKFFVLIQEFHTGLNQRVDSGLSKEPPTRLPARLLLPDHQQQAPV
jgi:hypothetical protein